MEGNPPIVLNLGKVNRKRVKQLKEGHGKLVDEVQEALEQIKASLGADAEGKELVPIVMVYEKKVRKAPGLPKIWWWQR